MMSKIQWFVLLCLLIIYILLGAVFFHELESRAEFKRRKEERIERQQIEELLLRHYNPGPGATTSDLFDRLTQYCGKTVSMNMSDDEPPQKWDFYHSLFFVITVVSTIGYGNLAPTTMLTRIFMIFYALIGIPINGIVMVTLGEFFGKKFVNLYRRWKSSKMHYDTARLGLIGQIILYLVPGFTLLIFIPSVFIMIFEGWSYDVSVYYAFVTLTTIGFGDIVAGVFDNHIGHIYFMLYKIFLLVWIIIGLGYVVMVMGFISRGMRSKQMHHIEHVLAHNIKKTPHIIREEFRSLLHDLLLTKVKRVYKNQFVYTPRRIERSMSCPDLDLYRNKNSPLFKRKRAYSEAIYNFGLDQRVQSDTELDKIDKDRTFEPARALMEQSDLLMLVVTALGKYKQTEESDQERGINCFSDEEILESEKCATKPKFGRKRACSEIQFPFSSDDEKETNNLTWYGPSATKKIIEIREKVKYGKSRSRTLPNDQPTSNLLSRIKNTFKTSSKENVKNLDIERQIPTSDDISKTTKEIIGKEFRDYIEATKRGRTSLFTDDGRYNKTNTRCRKYSAPESVLETTSIADLFRALTVISTPEAVNTAPKRKLGVASLTPPSQNSPPRNRRLPIRPPFLSRRSSLMPTTPNNENDRRRFSLRPTPILNEVSDYATLPARPPSYTPLPINVRRSIRVPGSNRKYSLRPVTNITTAPSPVQRQIMKTKDKDDQAQ